MDMLDFIVNDNNKICSVFKKKYRKKILDDVLKLEMFLYFIIIKISV